MVTVAFDATPLLGARTGVATLVDGWLRELAGRPELRLSGYGLTGSGWRRLAHHLPSGVRPARVPLPAGIALRAWSRFDLPPIEWITGRVEVVHGTNFVVPPARRAARLVTVHDLACVKFPRLCPPSALRYPELISRAVARGATVHVTTRSMADEVADYFKVPPDRLAVIAPGITTPAAPATQLPATQLPATELPATQLPATELPATQLPVTQLPRVTGAPYVLGLGTVEPRKDFPGLVRAFDQLAARHPDLELRIAGPSGWGEEALSEALRSARHRDRIHRLGWVDDPRTLLAGAAVFAYPSIYEGFGFPPLEAMALGVPVVATAAGAIPEVAGEAAALVPVGDATALADALDRVLTNTEERDRMVLAGARRVAHYNWGRAGDAMRDLYVALASR